MARIGFFFSFFFRAWREIENPPMLVEYYFEGMKLILFFQLLK